MAVVLPRLKSRFEIALGVAWVGLAFCLFPMPLAMAQDPAPAGSSSSQAATNAPSGPSRSPYLDWLPPSDEFDWIQLKSGEWLKGRIKAMQNRTLEFDSEEMDLLTFDWKDVLQLRSPTASVLFEDRETVVGAVTVDPFFVQVTGTESLRFPRSGLLGLTPGELKERNYWSGNVSLGLNLRAGNTEQSDLVAKAMLQRRTPNTRLRLEYIGNVSILDGIENVNNHRFNIGHYTFLTRRFFLMPFFGEYYQDRFQNIAHRGTAGLGAGYYLIDAPTVEWAISGGPAFQYTVFDSVEEDKDDHTSTPAFVFRSAFDKDLTKRLDLELSYQIIVTSREAGLATHHSVSTLEIELTKVFDLDISFIWDRIEEPQAGADGVEPEKNDFRLNLMLGIDF